MAEIADRMREDNRDEDFDEVLFDYTPLQPRRHRLYLPPLMRHLRIRLLAPSRRLS